MSHPKRRRIEERDLTGFKYFKKITRLLERLHDAGCARDRAGNRRLHMDQYLALLLLQMFNPEKVPGTFFRNGISRPKTWNMKKVPGTFFLLWLTWMLSGGMVRVCREDRALLWVESYTMS